MLRRSVKVQLVLFVVITLLGISYVSAEYIGIAKYVTGDNSCTVSADFASSGGIFTNAEVTYRGVTVGRVGQLHLVSTAPDLPKGGVRVDIDLDDCGSPKIPASSTANIANRSVVGEQYVNLVPPVGAGNNGPYLVSKSKIPTSKTTTPTPTEQLLVNLNDLITSVPLQDLKTTVLELGKAVNGRGPDLGSLLDSTSSLLKTANQPDNLQSTLDLITDSSSVLQTQLDVKSPLQSYAHSLNLLSGQLKKSDPDIRRLLNNGPADLQTVSSFIQTNRTDLAVTLNNLITLNTILVSHLGGVREIFEIYPALAAGGQGVLANNEGKLLLVLQAQTTPADCGDPEKGGQGYSGTVRRSPNEVGDLAPNVAARCTASATVPGAGASDPTNVRGSQNVPGGDPISLSGGGYAYPRVATSNTTSKASGTSATPSTKTAAQLYNNTQIGPAVDGTVSKDDPRYVSLLADALG